VCATLILMRLDLTSFLRSASGPFGGDNYAHRLVTRADGSIILQDRKKTVTGEYTSPIHEWAKLCWSFVDLAWKAVPRDIRNEWGMCVKRNTDRHRSALDEFRSVNIKRAMLFMPLITHPVDRFASTPVYLPKVVQGGRHPDSTHSQVWASGHDKAGAPFDPDLGDIPPLIDAIPMCGIASCFGDVPWSYDQVLIPFATPWPTDPAAPLCRLDSDAWSDFPPVFTQRDGVGIQLHDGLSKALGPGELTFCGNKQGTSDTESNYTVFIVPIDAVPNVVITYVRSGKTYHVHTMEIGALQYTDRTYVFTDYSAVLDGVQYVQSANDDKASTSATELKFTVDQPCTIHVLLNMRNNWRPPSCFYLTGWNWGDIADEQWHRDPLYTSRTSQASLERWYADVPLHTIKVFYLDCEDTEFYRPPWPYPAGTIPLKIPWPSAQCFEAKYECARDVQLSYACYWKPNQQGYAHGLYQLAAVGDVYGTFPWPEFVLAEPAGETLGDPLPCPADWAWILGSFSLLAFWGDLSHDNQWAGLVWDFSLTSHGRYSEPDSAGPSLVSCTDITCSDEGEWAGQWRFTLTVAHQHGNWNLLYKRPVTEEKLGVVGLYTLWDPGENTPWASPVVYVYQGYKNWNDDIPSAAMLILRQFAIVIAQIILVHVGAATLSYLKDWLLRHSAYSYSALSGSAGAIQPIVRGASKQQIICRSLFITQNPIRRKTDAEIAAIAWKIIHGRQILPLP